MTTKLHNVTPQSIVDATGVRHYEAVCMIANILNSDFTPALVAEWITWDVPDISYHSYIELEIDNLVTLMKMGSSEMFDIKSHQQLITFLSELEKIQALS